jgi:hypothetical protein
MNLSQEVIKAWWFDRLSDLVAQNMALAAELQAMREGRMDGGAVNKTANGGSFERQSEAQHG